MFGVVSVVLFKYRKMKRYSRDSNVLVKSFKSYMNVFFLTFVLSILGRWTFVLSFVTVTGRSFTL